MRSNTERHQYRLHLGADNQGEAADLEFDARGSDIALNLTAKYCGNRAVALFEDGRKLADVKQVNGVWLVSETRREPAE
jgi:hypothetical protein